MQPPQILAEGIKTLGLSLPAEAPARLLAYQAELLKWNSAYNLTAIRDPQAMVTRHLLDSLSLLPLLNDGTLLDVGSGAGLPALVLAIARPELPVVALDSNGKKARFMRHAVRALHIDNARVIEGRVEDLASGETFPQIVSRAFARLADFVSLTRHLLAPGGQWVAMKGKLDAGERAALPADCQVQATHRLQVPGLNEDRHALLLTLKSQ
ncbi:MAG: rsmG [Hydrocarboniphaga sp.]|uniref:16S rRNA (guanine(527)-N(7))-methyltransferase RsmG n=1 Tax=Hydrocarboniphaga sp. TaxID=2033016 RepID=UPI00260F7116|nr:16S rRNA (guanine(527)-N(7))-methyltransferase RsmG [Hydrocarboniphaga sp.]MDB5973015.1 rsmG [Hydrocarboniphaga sp.]